MAAYVVVSGLVMATTGVGIQNDARFAIAIPILLGRNSSGALTSSDNSVDSQMLPKIAVTA